MRVLIDTFWLGAFSSLDAYTPSVLKAYRKSDRYKWLTKHSYKPLEYPVIHDVDTYAYRTEVHAWLTEQDLTYYTLKWR